MDNESAASQPTVLVTTNPRIEEHAAFSIVGTSCEASPGDTGPIGEAWGRFFQAPAPAGQEGVLATIRFNEQGGFHYTAAYRVPAGTEVPQGFEAAVVPAQKYASWRFEGDPANIPQAYMAIFGEHLAAAGLSADMNGIHLEVYPTDGWDEASGIMKADICIAVL
jgi:predicted transcriptional regulator YdeE